MKGYILSIGILFSATFICCAQIPKTITFQGYLTDATDAAITGTRDFEFSLYESPTVGAKIWFEVHNAVQITKGLYNVILGGNGTPLSSLAFDKPYYLEIKITSSNETLLPRLTLTSSAYSLSSINASNITTGILPNERLDADLQDLADGSLSGTLVGPGINAANITVGAIAGSIVSTGVDAANITTGTISNTRLDTDLQDLADGTLSGSLVGSGVDAGNITTGNLSLASGKFSVNGTTGNLAKINNVSYSFPATTGAAGTYLRTDDLTGNLSWSSPVTTLNSLTGSVNIAAGTNISSVSTSGNTITINAAGGLAGSGTSGNVSFWNGTASVGDDNEFTWNSTTNLLGVNGTINATSGQFGSGGSGTLTVGPSGALTINNNGDITKLKGLNYSFPSSHNSAGAFLANDGNGTLSWNFDSDFSDLASNLSVKATTMYTDEIKGKAGLYPSLYDRGGNNKLTFDWSSPAFKLFVDEVEMGRIAYLGGIPSSRELLVWDPGPNYMTTATGIFHDGATFNVGIGTTTPSQKLEVNGQVKATSFAGSGASLTALTAANVTGTNTLPSGVLPTTVPLGNGVTDRLTIWSGTGTVGSNANLTWNGTTNTLSATNFSGNGSALSSLTAANLTGTNTLPSGVLPTTVPLGNGVTDRLTLWSGTGTVGSSANLTWNGTTNTLSANNFSGNGSSLSSLTAANLTGTNTLPSGVLPTTVPLGNGSTDRLTIWSGTGTVGSNANLTWNGTTNTLSATNGTFSTAITVGTQITLNGVSTTTIQPKDTDLDDLADGSLTGSKVSPDFGSQNIITTGTMTASSLGTTSNSATLGNNLTTVANSIVVGHYAGLTASGSIYLTDNSVGTTATSKSAVNRLYGRFDNGYFFYTNAAETLGVSLANGATSWGTISDSTKKENFRAVDGEKILAKISGLRLGTWNYKASPDSRRHYGPFAQEFFRAFGRDELGTVGCDTLIYSQDIEGLNITAIQALIKSTTQQNKLLNDRLDMAIQRLNEQDAIIEKLLSLVKAEHKNETPIAKGNSEQ